MRLKRVAQLISTAAFVALTFATARAVTAPASTATLSPQPQGAEVAFVRAMQSDLGVRFATVRAAERAGYFRYTNEDDTGAISYANLHWHSSDPEHPSQLWYDVHGNLLGADFSVPRGASTQPPQLFGVSAQRWVRFRAHVHYVLVAPDAVATYGATSIKKFTAAGGNVRSPGPQTLVTMGIAKRAGDVAHVFVFPAIWDLIVWIKPNPNGAFADKNPAVIPSAAAETDSM
jgi:hypothetical protein